MRKADINNFAFAYEKGSTMAEFFDSIPLIQMGNEIREVANEVRRAKTNMKQVILGLGGHVIKCGLSPLLCQLIEDGFITSVAMNGAAMIHDMEVGKFGNTSQNVDIDLKHGQFGFDDQADQLCYEMNMVLNEAWDRKYNPPSAHSAKRDLVAGNLIRDHMYAYTNSEFKSACILYTCAKKGIPVTIHTAIGADINHMHHSFDGKIWGEALHNDFAKFCGMVQFLKDGVYINMGSSVILPEVFLKAVSIAIKGNKEPAEFTTVVFDFMKQYRPSRNVVERPTNKGIYIVGSHELTIPLLAAMILED
jgi:hypothetical protein